MDSKTVFALRNEAKHLKGNEKTEKLNNALYLASNLNKSEPFNEWVQKALAWVLIDLCKYHISNNTINQSLSYFNKLCSINFIIYDEIIEEQKKKLKPKIDSNYSKINKAEELSKLNRHQEALNIFKNLISLNQLNDLHHESFGWIIYRHIKQNEKALTSIQVRTFLRDYLKLKNERPSLLHSMILNFALHYSKENLDFNLYRFFELWNPKYFRREDLLKQRYIEKDIPSLLSRVFRAFIENDYSIDCQFLLSNVKIDPHFNNSSTQRQVLDLLREPYFWKIYNAKKEGNNSVLWKLFDDYLIEFAKFPKSKWNSDILGLAERYMVDVDNWRFLEFFKSWNPNNFMDGDWTEIVKGEKTYKPLAVKCLKKVCEIIIGQKNKAYNIDWLFLVYDVAISKLPYDEWLKRDKALLLIEVKEFIKAKKIYQSLVISLGDKSYIWHELSSCLNNTDIKIGMLSKAIQLEKNEDYLGEVHLDLSKALIENDLFENALIELNNYKKHREFKAWNLSETYFSLLNRLSGYSTSTLGNQDIYKHYIPFAEDYAYQDIEWTELVLIECYKIDKKKERLKFSNGKDIEFSFNKKRFNIFKEYEIGNVFAFKLNIEQKIAESHVKNSKLFRRLSKPIVEKIYKPLIFKKSKKANWAILEDELAVIDFINKDKNVIHAISSKNQEIFYKDDISKYKINDFIKGKLVITKRKEEIRIDLKNVEIIDSIKGLEHFSKVLAVVDNVNKEKRLFHFVADRKIHGIVKFNETNLRPIEGEFLEIWLAEKIDSNLKKSRYKSLKVVKSEKTSEELRKDIIGELKLKFKDGPYTREFNEIHEEELSYIKPDFAFISDQYVPKFLIKKCGIKSNCVVKATAVFCGEKWKVINIEILD